MRFAIYSRKSVLTGRGESIENQVELCRSYLAAHYPGVRPEEVAVYEDEGFSGKDFQRPQFRRMLEDIRRARPEALVCYRLDRVSRSVGDFADLIRRLEGWGVAFLCIREKFDTSTPMGKAMMYIASVFAQLERETIAQRVRDNMCLLARTGRWLGGTTPTGFRAERTAEVIVDGRARTACRLVPDPAEWGRAAAIFRLFLARQSLSGLSRALAEEGITARTGRPFSLPGLREILQNPVYCAADRDAWDYFAALGADLCFPRADCDGRRGLLSGLLFCARCGEKLLPKARKGGSYDYICRAKLRRGAAACSCPNLSGAAADQAALDALSAQFPRLAPRLEELAREEQRAACRILLQRADWDGADLAFTLCRL